MTKLLKINLGLFLIAMALAAYMIWHHYAIVNGDVGFGSFCSINQTFDCDSVNASEYSEFLGIPLATYAFGYYFFGAIMSLIAIRSAYSRREALFVLFSASTVSIVASLATLFLMVFGLKKVCIFCSSMHLIDFITFAITALTVRQLGCKRIAHQKALIYAALGVAGFLITYGITAQLKQELPLDEKQFLSDFTSQPVVNIDPGTSPRQGFMGDNPPLRLIEFADFQCPACANAAKQMHHLVRLYGNKVQLIFKYFPLDPSCNPNVKRPMHEYACLSAKAAYCANQQGKFVEYYEKLFNEQRQISRENIRTWAKELGINMPSFETCISAPETLAAVQHDIDLAAKNGLISTPTFFANGRKVEGAIDETRLRLILKESGK